MKHEKEGQPGEECEVEKCVCGLEICLGGAEVEIDEVCHRIGNPCYIIEPKISEEKKDWEGEMSEGAMSQVWCRLNDNEIEILKSFIREKLKEEREKWSLKNAGLYRQLFGEMNRTFTSKELWEILYSYNPLFTEEQKKELKDNLYNSIMKKK